VRRFLITVATGFAILLLGGCGTSPHAPKRNAVHFPHRHFPAPLDVTWTRPQAPPEGVVLLLPGGAWKPDPHDYARQIAVGRSISAGGFATVAVLYGREPSGFAQIQGVYWQARRRYPNLPVCVEGDSAGGHLALMLAAREHAIRCVIDLAGPTDLTTLQAQGASAAYLAVQAFGAHGLRRWSPVRVAQAIRAKVLMVYARNDPVVPYAQATEMKKALPGAKLISLPAGTAGFIHSAVDGTALQRAIQAEQALLRSAVTGG
jgi:acetyl esterase/lipase